MKRKAGKYKIRRRKYSSGRVGFQVDFGMVNGVRKQPSFPSRAEAERAVEEFEELKEVHGTRAGDVAPEAMAEMLVAVERLRAAGGMLAEAVDFWILHASRMRRETLLRDLKERFVESRKKAGLSVRYVNQLGVSLGSLVSKLPPLRKAHEVTREDLEAWLLRGGWQPKTRNNYLGDVSTLFEWAIKEGFARVNPAKDLARARVANKEIETLSVDECWALLVECREDLAVLPYVVIGLFCGVRPAEINRLDWGAVDLTEGYVIISGAQAKTRARRVVDISGNALAWLRLVPEAEREGRICKRGFDDSWRLARRRLGWDVGNGAHRLPKDAPPVTRGEWKHNALRHTFASMHYAEHRDERALQTQMGHESAAMLHKHYRAVKTKAEAARFWGLLPEGEVPAVDVSAGLVGD